MQINLVAIGHRMPSWVNQGVNEYAKRLPPQCSLTLIEIPAGKRSSAHDLARVQRQESEQMLAAIPEDNHVIALDIQGKLWSTGQLSQALTSWQTAGRDVTLLIGGPEGLSDACLSRATQRWSLSPLTFPHPLVRIIMAEQIYRAYSILQNHPYHR